MSWAGVISPPGTRGTTEYEPLRWRLARWWSLVSWRAACSPSRTWPGSRVARIEATTGLQMSQPSPVPWATRRPVKVVRPVTRRISYSSARVCGKCSHSPRAGSTPCSARLSLTRPVRAETQLPQPVPALVHRFTPATSVSPCVRTASRTAPPVTWWQEQTTAESGRAGAGPSPWALAGRTSRSAGTVSGSPARVRARRVPYASVSPTRTPPVRALSGPTRSFL